MSGPALPVLPTSPIGRPLDNTALSAYMACPREYWMGMVLHRRGDGGDSAPLTFGSVVHIILDTHYKTGGSVALAEFAARNWWADHGHKLEGEHRTLERAILDYKRYREKWGQTPADEQGETVGWPDEPMVEMSFNVEGGGLAAPWAGKIDRIIELGGLHYVEDHKTTSRLDKNFYSAFELSNQMMGYTRAGQLLAPGLKIVGVRLNVIHVLKEKTNFERQLITFTREQLSEWERNVNRWTERIQRDMAEWPSEEEIMSGEGEWPIAHYGDNGCARKYGLCHYHRVCGVASPFRHRALAELPINPWNPLEVSD